MLIEKPNNLNFKEHLKVSFYIRKQKKKLGFNITYVKNKLANAIFINKFL